MDSKILNQRINAICDQQEGMLKKALEAKVALTDTEEAQYAALDKELVELNASVAKIDALNTNRVKISTPNEQAVITEAASKKKFYAAGGYKKATVLDKVNDDYAEKFWASLQSPQTFQTFLIQNASLGELGTSTAGGALVPIETDPTIPALAIEETVCRSLSRVIETSMDINLPYQSVKTVAALKAESNSSGTNAFASNSPGFATTKLSAFTLGDAVTASWELLRDAKAASQFITEDLQRAIRVKEENLFVNGTGTNQPQGYLGNGATATGASITSGAATLGINPIIDTMGSLNRAYYVGASWLVNRQEFNRLLKTQIAASQYQVFIQFSPNGDATLFGYPVAFSAEMPVYSASPSTTGAWMFGNFPRFATIGDRGGSNIYIKVLNELQALNGQTVIMGYRYTDQRVILQEAVVQLNTNG